MKSDNYGIGAAGASKLLTLSSIPPKSKCRVVAVSSADARLCNKLVSMGIIPGTELEVVCLAPLGDPIEIQALGYKLSLRRSEAKHITVERLS